MARKKLKDIFVSVILLAEDSPVEETEAAIKNITDQLHKNIEIIISSFVNLDSIKNKFAKDWRLKFIDSTPGEDYFQKCFDKVSGDYIFYKTVTSVLWFPAHITAHLEEFNGNDKIAWQLSRLEYRDEQKSNHPLNTIGFRIASPPAPKDIIIDEICHKPEVKIDWRSCIAVDENTKENFFAAGKVLDQWNALNLLGAIPDEITIAQWVKIGEENSGKPNYEQIAKQLGVPLNTELKEENKLVDGNIEVVRSFPTIMGNKFHEEYNKQVRNILDSTEDITSIAIKRTMGMGDIVLVEPIIKKLRQKYSNAKITLYTAKPDIVKYDSNKPDTVTKIEDGDILKDYLASTNDQLKFDLDLAYESRLKNSFIDSYAEVCDIKWSNYKDKYCSFRIAQENFVDYFELDKFVVVVGDGSGWVGKTWKEEEYKKVVQHLLDKGYKVVEPGMSMHSGLTDPKYHGCDLNSLVNLINQCEFYIGGDNGPMHISRALGKKSIIIAGAALPYYSNPDRTNIYYIQDNNLDCLGCKHTQFFVLRGEQLSFVPECVNEVPGQCMKSLLAEHVYTGIEKLENTVFTFMNTKADFAFNIPGCCYYYDELNDLYVKEYVDFHPDQEKDISTEYDFRWEEIYEKYSVPFVEEVMKNYKFTTGVSTFLDVGCNMGLVVKAAFERGWDAYGVDINVPSIKKAVETFPELHTRVVLPEVVKNHTWDVISMNQTLEHISNPVEFLKEWSSKLNDNGIMFIGVPSMDESGAREAMHKYGTLGVGEHSWLPTNQSFNKTLKLAGLEFEDLQDRSKGIFVKVWKV